ncbi:MAG: hypothetical protein PHT94_01305 [Candidatus Nanoarchaeia archaeon]|nr:hypothetical protein [Candidatus Nanoarchaeia archaeon]
MDYNIEARLFIENNEELISFKDTIIKFIDFFIENNNNNNNKSENLFKKLPKNKIEKIKEFLEFVKTIEEFEYLQKDFEKMPEEQDVYENEPIEFKNNIIETKIYLIEKANGLFMLNINFLIKDKDFSKIIIKELIGKIKLDFDYNKDEIIENVEKFEDDVSNEIIRIQKNNKKIEEKFIEYFQEDFKIYVRLDKNDLIKNNIFNLKYGDNSIWIKIKPFVFKKDFIQTRRDFIKDFF